MGSLSIEIGEADMHCGRAEKLYLKNGENSDNSGFDHVYVLNIHADIELVIKRSFQGLLTLRLSR